MGGYRAGGRFAVADLGTGEGGGGEELSEAALSEDGNGAATLPRPAISPMASEGVREGVAEGGGWKGYPEATTWQIISRGS